MTLSLSPLTCVNDEIGIFGSLWFEDWFKFSIHSGESTLEIYNLSLVASFLLFFVFLSQSLVIVEPEPDSQPSLWVSWRVLMRRCKQAWRRVEKGPREFLIEDWWLKDGKATHVQETGYGIRIRNRKLQVPEKKGNECFSLRCSKWNYFRCKQLCFYDLTHLSRGQVMWERTCVFGRNGKQTREESAHSSGIYGSWKSRLTDNHWSICEVIIEVTTRTSYIDFFNWVINQ